MYAILEAVKEILQNGGKIMCKYYGYIRVSTETQSEKGFGLDSQRAAIEEYAAQHEYTLTKVYVDSGISANVAITEDDDAITKRHALMELLADVEKGDTVIALNTSRLWRSDLSKALIRRELIRREVKLVFIQSDYDIYRAEKDPKEYLQNAILEALDIYDRMGISIKLAKGRTAKARTGAKPAGVCPFGYQYAPDKKSVIVNESEADAVHYMFTEAQKGRTLSEIVTGLTAKGIMTRHGKPWSRGSVANVLKNQFYTGVLIHAGKPIKGTHTAIISKIQFGKVQAQLDRRHK